MNVFLNWFLIFIVMSFMGWLMETIGFTIINKKFTARGFLIGPYCPVYGVGSICMMFFLKRYLDDPITLFLMAIILTSFVEYIASLLMEKIYGARWWDYSQRKFNLNGRVCLGNSICFGFLGLLLLYVMEPFLLTILAKMPTMFLLLLSLFLLIIFITDIIISSNIVFKIKNSTILTRRDNTEEISKKVRLTLSKNLVLIKRIINAFPKFKLLDNNISITSFKVALDKLEIENKQKKLKHKKNKLLLKTKLKEKELKNKHKELKRKKF
ncbi:MAG: putative ABC transporter permease [Bacilli bacterium]